MSAYFENIIFHLSFAPLRVPKTLMFHVGSRSEKNYFRVMGNRALLYAVYVVKHLSFSVKCEICGKTDIPIEIPSVSLYRTEA